MTFVSDKTFCSLLFTKAYGDVQFTMTFRALPPATSPFLPSVNYQERDVHVPQRSEQRLDADAGFIYFLFGESGVDDVYDVVDRERRLGDVGRDDDFAARRTVSFEW